MILTLGIIFLSLGLVLSVAATVVVRGARKDEAARKLNQYHDPKTGLRANKKEVSQADWDKHMSKVRSTAAAPVIPPIGPAGVTPPIGPAGGVTTPPKSRYGYPVLATSALPPAKTGEADTILGLYNSSVTGRTYFYHYGTDGDLVVRREPLTEAYQGLMAKRQEQRKNDPDYMFTVEEGWEEVDD